MSREGNELVIGPTRTDASVPDVPLPASLVPALRAHLDAQSSAGALAVVGGFDPGG